MAANPVLGRIVAIWVAVVLAAGAVAAGAGAATDDSEAVAAAGGTIDDGPSRRAATSTTATTTPATTTTTAPAAPTTTAPALVIEPPTTAAPAPTTVPVEPEVTSPPTTEPPPAPSFSMSPTTISMAMVPGNSPIIHTGGEGCTGPDHTGGEYGVVGIVTTADGLVFEGDYVAAAPGGRWESNMHFNQHGAHQHHYRCQRADGTPLFEYAPQTFTVTP
jgi:hypothetical protein